MRAAGPRASARARECCAPRALVFRLENIAIISKARASSLKRRRSSSLQHSRRLQRLQEDSTSHLFLFQHSGSPHRHTSQLSSRRAPAGQTKAAAAAAAVLVREENRARAAAARARVIAAESAQGARGARGGDGAGEFKKMSAPANVGRGPPRRQARQWKGGLGREPCSVEACRKQGQREWATPTAWF